LKLVLSSLNQLVYMPYDIWGFFIWNLRFFKNTSSSWGKQRSILSWWFLKNFKCWFEIFDDVRLLKVKAQNFTLHFLNLFIYFALHEFSINNFLEFKSVICSPWITSCSLLSSMLKHKIEGILTNDFVILIIPSLLSWISLLKDSYQAYSKKFTSPSFMFRKIVLSLLTPRISCSPSLFVEVSQTWLMKILSRGPSNAGSFISSSFES